MGVIYAAPVSHRHASRVRFLIEYFRKPFVLHYWDFMDGGMADATADTRWLIANAARIFVLSKKMRDEISAFHVQPAYLTFTREPSRFQARPPDGPSLKIVFMGFVATPAYHDSLFLLKTAIEAVAKRGVDVTVTYLGAEKQFALPTERFGDMLTFTGFKDDNDARDAALAEAHVAFLTGPSALPENDHRAKYSVPSRILDFMAVGLPTLAAVHPDTATADFLAAPSFKAIRHCRSAEAIAEALLDLARPALWHETQRDTLAGFALYRDTYRPEKTLKEALVHIGRLSASL